MVYSENKKDFEINAKDSFNECGEIIVDSSVSSLTFYEKIAIKADIIFRTSDPERRVPVTFTCPEFKEDDPLFVVRYGYTASFSNIRIAGCDMKTDNLFIVKEGSTLIIENSVFKRNISKNGGIVKVSDSSTLTIKNTVAKKNNVTASGGVINCDSSTLNLEDCDFFDNYAVSNGGVIYSSGCTSTITNCDFNRNRATSQAGAIGLYKNSKSTVSKTLFKRNISYSGGAIYATESEFSVNDCRLAENYADYRGGAINVYVKCIFSASQTVFRNNTSIDSGGDIKSKEALLEISSCAFEGSRSGKDGGSLSINDGNTTVTDSIFRACKSQGVGGGLLLRNDYSIFQNVTVTECFAPSNGGAIKIDEHGHSAWIDSEFTSNSGDNGAACFVDSTDVVFENFKCSDNIAASGDGGCLNLNNNDVIILYSKFSNNTADNGGDISARNVTLAVNSTSFSTSKAKDTGGSFSSTGYARGDFIECEFNENYAVNRGGAIDIYNSTIGVLKCSFNGNGCEGEGGAIRSNIYDRYLSLVLSSFNKNYASEGAAVFAVGTHLDIIEDTFSENRGYLTGALHVVSSLNVTIDKTKFIDNYSDGKGGFCYLESKANALVTECEFIRSSAYTDGGILFMQNSCNAYMTKSYLEDPYSEKGRCFVGQSGRESYFGQSDNVVKFTDPLNMEHCAENAHQTQFKTESP